MSHFAPSQGKLVFKIWFAAFAIAIATGCAVRSRHEASAVRAVKESIRHGNSVTMHAVSFYKPLPEPVQARVTLEAAQARLKAFGVELPQNAVASQLSDGETVFFANDGLGLSPVASVAGADIFEWETLTPLMPSGASVRASSVNAVFRHPVNAVDESPDQVAYLMYPTKEDAPILVSVSDHGIGADNVLRRNGNRFFNPQGELALQFELAQKNIWRVKGSWYDGFVCGGSVIWKSGERWYIITQEFGHTSVSRWSEQATELSLEEVATDVAPPPEVARALAPCSQNRDLSAAVASLDYDRSFDQVAKDSKVVELIPGTDYPTGASVRWDDSEWVLLESHGSAKDYVLLNKQRTFGGEDGGQFQAVYKVNASGLTKVTRLANARDYMLAAAARIQILNDERIAQQHIVGEYMATAQKYLSIAEAKANQVGAGWGEWYKPVAIAFSTAIGDVAMRGGGSTASKVLGVPVGEASLGKAAVVLANRSERLTAAVYLTALQGLAVSAPVLATKFNKATLAEQLNGSTELTAYTAAVNGLRSWFPVTSRSGVAMSFASGLAMRWRKMQIEKRLGYENQKQLWNLAAGGLAGTLQVLAIDKGPGAVGAIGQAGFLVSECISGRGTPGVIVGSTIEGAAQLFVKHPAIRPFAVALVSQVAALIQIGDAYRVGQSTSGQLDQARAMRIEQVQKANALIYILKNNLEATSNYSTQELSLVVGTAQDPFSGFRDHQ